MHLNDEPIQGETKIRKKNLLTWTKDNQCWNGRSSRRSGLNPYQHFYHDTRNTRPHHLKIAEDQLSMACLYFPICMK